MREPTSRTIGAFAVWTSSDLPGFGDQLIARLTERELLRRLPGWRATWYAPLGWTRPIPEDGGYVAAPLRDHSSERIEQIAASADASVLAPAFPLGAARADWPYPDGTAHSYFTEGLDPDAERTHPLISSCVRIADEPPVELVTALARQPYLTVRDRRSCDRLAAAGLSGDIPVVPHPALLLDGLVDADALRTRAQHLRQLGVLPENGGVVVVQSAELPVDAVREFLAADHVVEMPSGLVLEDQLALLNAASAVIATDEHVAAASAALGKPWALFDPTGEQRWPALEFGSPKQIVDRADRITDAISAGLRFSAPSEHAKRAVSTHFDRVAAAIEQAFTARGGDLTRRIAELAEENNALRHAQWRLRDRMLVERQKLSDTLAEAWHEVADAKADAERARNELAVAQTQFRELRNEIDRLALDSRELDALRNTKLLRWSQPVREVYGKIKGS
ncbi:hypothetical protein GCM10022247_16050 [Allokutzneria multivorans]|uniref:Uncharacterized protein n=1 Tax=Allokutzneria multivorans TaxID=1142134 RepID=A0ABP7RFP2_9PSEU